MNSATFIVSCTLRKDRRRVAEYAFELVAMVVPTEPEPVMSSLRMPEMEYSLDFCSWVKSSHVEPLPTLFAAE